MRETVEILCSDKVVNIVADTKDLVEFIYKGKSDYYTVAISHIKNVNRVSISAKDRPWRWLGEGIIDKICDLCFKKGELVELQTATFSSIKTLTQLEFRGFEDDGLGISCDVHFRNGKVDNLIGDFVNNEFTGLDYDTDEIFHIPLTKIKYISRVVQ